MRITIDEDRCCGAGQCVLTAPEVFDQRDEDGLVALLVPSPPAAQYDDVRQAALACPTGAIEVDE